jgi:NitT/TauT family transport system ATP-binding protein
LVAGLDAPSAGTVRVADAGGALVDPRDQLGKRLGASKHDAEVAFVFQDPHLLPWRTVAANVALPLELRRVGSSRERRERAERALEQVRLANSGGRYPAELSGGMRMRVSIARALVTKPSLLLLDEPFAALDEITRQALDESLRSLWQEHRLTVVFVTHSIAEAVFLAERAIVMAGPPARVVHDDAIRLPRERDVALRGEGIFAAETARLYAALSQGSAR